MGRFLLLAAGLSLTIAAPAFAQPIIIPLSPQPQRNPPPPPPPSPVPIAPAQTMSGEGSGGQVGAPRPPTIVYNGGGTQRNDGAAAGNR